LSWEEFWHRRAEENAHNEVLAYLTMLLGVVLLVGGLLITIIVTENPTWIILLPYQLPSNRSAMLALILTTAGFALLSVGFVLVISYDQKRSWYIKQIEKATKYRKKRIDPETLSKLLGEYLGKEKSGD